MLDAAAPFNESLLVDVRVALLALGLTIPRVLTCLLILPGFGTRTLTGMARNGLAIAMALPAVVPAYHAVRETPPDLFLMIALIVKEASIGAMLGVMLALPIWITQSIGSILDTQRQPLQLQSNNASLDPDASAIGAVMLQATMLIMIQAGLYVAMVRILIESYAAWPALSLLPPFEPGHLDVIIKRFADFFWNLVVYGAPVIIPLMLIEFAFAILGVFAQGLQVSFASSPVKSLVGMLIVLLYWPTLSHYVAADFSHMLDFLQEYFHAGGRTGVVR